VLRFEKEKRLVVDELTRDEDTEKLFPGVLTLVRYSYDDEFVYVNIGTTRVGWITIDDLVAVAKQIVEWLGVKESEAQ